MYGLNYKVIAVDFDGTLCKNSFPNIGTPRKRVIRKLKKEIKNGAKVILWTCRWGDKLEEAIEWCKLHGITFDAVNENLDEVNSLFSHDSKKVGADEYWDDKGVRI